jgi:hypothetical protein
MLLNKTYKTTEGSIIVVTTKGQGALDNRKMLARLQFSDGRIFANVGGCIGVLCLARNEFRIRDEDTKKIQGCRETFLDFLKESENAGSPIIVGIQVPGLPRFTGSGFVEIVNKKNEKIAA